MHEPDVLHVLPLIGPCAQTLFEQRDGQVGPARPARVRPRPGRSPRTDRRSLNRGSRRGGQIEQRVEQRVASGVGAASIGGGSGIRACVLKPLLRAAVVLEGANPVEVGRQCRVGAASAAEPLWPDVTYIASSSIARRRKAPFARRLQLHGARQQRQRDAATPVSRINARPLCPLSAACPRHYLKSRREKMNIETTSSIAMYSAA